MAIEIIDVSNRELSDKALTEIDNISAGNRKDPKVFYRLSKAQVQRIAGLVYVPHQLEQKRMMGEKVELSYSAAFALAEAQVGNLYDVYSAIPAGSYYFNDSPLSWLSKKRFDGFVTRELDFWIHLSADERGGALGTPDRMIQFEGSFSSMMLHNHSSVFSETRPIAENELRAQIKSAVEEQKGRYRGHSMTVGCSRAQGSDFGFLPLTAFTDLNSGEEVFGFLERFLGFTEIEIPYSEAAYNLQFPDRRDYLSNTRAYGDELKAKVLAKIAAP